jgi:H+/Cl- antiporter ClcA
MRWSGGAKVAGQGHVLTEATEDEPQPAVAPPAMVAEMTGSFSVVPGAIIAVGIASLLMSRTNVTIYKAQRSDRTTAEAERERQQADE